MSDFTVIKDDDVCEWVQPPKTYPHETSCGHDVIMTDYWPYCPFCRKKIKDITIYEDEDK